MLGNRMWSWKLDRLANLVVSKAEAAKMGYVNKEWDAFNSFEIEGCNFHRY